MIFWDNGLQVFWFVAVFDIKLNEDSGFMAEILVLDDEEETRELSEMMLENKVGEDIESAASVEEIEDFVGYDVVVSDYSGINTAEVYEEADEVVIFSGYAESDLDTPDEVDHVQKGAGYDELVETVEDKLRN